MKPDLQKIQMDFLSKSVHYKMSVITDDGVVRLVRFKLPETSAYHYDITTWPGHLCISGDMGTWVFKRLTDMFEFFRMDDKDFNFMRDSALNINPSYWSEKLCMGVHDSGKSAKEWDQDVFKQLVFDFFKENYPEMDDWEMEDDYEETKGRCLEKVEDEILSCENEHDALAAVFAFSHGKLDMQDYYPDANVYKYQFIWCLYAIVWAIKEYDKIKEIVAA